MKTKIDLEKFVRSLMERYYEKIHIDPTTTKCWLDSVLEDQGLEYKDGEIVEIDTIDTSSPEWTEIVERCKHTTLEPLFFEKGKWYTCIAKVGGFKVGHAYQSKMDGTVSNDDGAMYGYHNDVNLIFRPATDDEIPHEPPSKPDYENLSIINEGDDGVLLYFTKNGRGISDFHISKDTARWLHGKLGEYLEMYDEKSNKKNHVSVILPILSWTDEDVAEFIQERGIKCHPLYYDEQGNFHPERQLGCMGCPLQSDAGRSEFKDNPKLFRQIVKASKVWWNTHPHLKSHKKFGTIYGLVAHDLFYKSYADWQAADNNLFGRTDWKKELEQYFNIELP